MRVFLDDRSDSDYFSKNETLDIYVLAVFIFINESILNLSYTVLFIYFYVYLFIFNNFILV